jgi:hypothetical protein
VAVVATFELDDGVGVAARAARALIAASVPELTKRTRPIDGISARTFPAELRFEWTRGAETVPRFAAAATARTRPRGAWPRMSGPHDITCVDELVASTS